MSGRPMAEPPAPLVCPITSELMSDPVMTADGHSYERSAILKWLETHDTSPLTGAVLPSKSLKDNHALSAAVDEWKVSNSLRLSLSLSLSLCLPSTKHPGSLSLSLSLCSLCLPSTNHPSEGEQLSTPEAPPHRMGSHHCCGGRAAVIIRGRDHITWLWRRQLWRHSHKRGPDRFRPRRQWEAVRHTPGG